MVLWYSGAREIGDQALVEDTEGFLEGEKVFESSAIARSVKPLSKAHLCQVDAESRQTEPEEERVEFVARE